MGPPYQGVDASEGLVGVVQGIEQLENAVVGLAVPIEADANGCAVGREGTLMRGEVLEPWPLRILDFNPNSGRKRR